MKQSFGFTLVELMVVVVIIAVLLAIAIPVYINTVNNTEKIACEANVRTIDSSCLQFFHDNDRYPTDLNELLSPPYLQSIPACPGGGTYNYDSSTGKVECSLPRH